MKTKAQLAAEAKEAGRKHFTAHCRHHGPASQHYASTRLCVQCKREENKRYSKSDAGKASSKRRADNYKTAQQDRWGPPRFVYLLSCPAAGIAYVGSTAQELYSRRAHHFTVLADGTHGNPALLSAYRKHGPDAFVFEELARFPAYGVEDLRRFEQFYMDAGAVRGLRLVNVQRAA